MPDVTKSRLRPITPADPLPSAGPQSCTVELPVADPEAGYVPQHLNVPLNNRQGLAMRRIYTALNHSNHRTADGRRIESYADAARFILERVATATEGVPK